ncbi:MAG: terminase family protein [Patescibacteria group bacterium]|nr:terminase family protein [Patescibacteria group bacterium]
MRGLRVDAGQLASLEPGERERVARELAVVEVAFRENPLLGYRPHGKQVVFHGGPWPAARLFLGGNRSGKTTATMVDTTIQAVDRDVVPEHLVGFKRWEPPCFCRVVTPDLTATLDGVVLQKFREWCPRSQFHGNSFDRAFDKVQRVLRFKNGSWVQFMSNDQDLDKFGGAALHRVVYDEEPRQDIRRECLMRLIDYGGEELYGMTPLHGMSWVYDEFFEPWERGQLTAEDARIVVVDMDDNPHLDRATMARVLSGLSDEERQARKSGRFVSFAGLIYGSFSTSTHVVPEFEQLPEGVEVFRGIDPGYRHMCAVIYAFLDAEDRLVVFDEIALQGATVKEICQEIKLRDSRWKVSPRWTVIDPASRNKNNQTGRSDQQEFSDNGVPTIPGQNAVTAGINRVKERLDYRTTDGVLLPRLLVAANCTELRAEFKRYRWQKESTRVENESKEAPVKRDDHLLDALRYIVMQRPLAPDRDLVAPTATMKDRLLRRDLARMFRDANRPALVDHPSGPGLFQ